MLDPGRPAYQALLDAIALAIESGELESGARLPPQRDLADALGVNLGTVSRAYSLSKKRGLTQGEVGRGTFVKAQPGPARPFKPAVATLPGAIDLSMDVPFAGLDPELDTLLGPVLSSPHPEALLRYQPPGGSDEQRAAGATWISQNGFAVSSNDVLICNGAQQALFLCLNVLTEPGQTVLSEELTYPGFSAAAEALGLVVQGVPLDEHGPDPDVLGRLARKTRAKVLYLVPSLHNPTTLTLPRSRRRALVEVAEKHDLKVIEDDILRPLASKPPPTLASLAPERVLHIASLSKAIAGGLRVAYLAAPEVWRDRLVSRLLAMGWMTAPLLGECARRFIESGAAARLATQRREHLEPRRQRLLESAEGHPLKTAPGCYHAWLQLPQRWQPDAFALELARQNVLVRPASNFYLGRDAPPRAIRISLTGAASGPALDHALDTLWSTLQATGPRAAL